MRADMLYSPRNSVRVERIVVHFFWVMKKMIIHREGENIYPCWNKGGEKTIKDIMRLVGDQCWSLKSKCDETDDLLKENAFRNGYKKLAQILPVYRNFMANHRLVMNDDIVSEILWGNIREAYECFPALLLWGRII